MPAFYRFSREWEGETCFIVAGGPSVKDQPLERLKGRKVIAVKASWQAVPFADFLVFSDARFWEGVGPWSGHGHYAKLKEFAGRIVMPHAKEKMLFGERLLITRRVKPPGLATEPDALSVNWTVITPALNAAMHLGVKRIVLLGADNRLSIDCPYHRAKNDKRGTWDQCNCHHHAPNPTPLIEGNLARMRDELGSCVAPLKGAGIEVINCSPGSALPFWPVMGLADYLDKEA
jgi:hypothetical protein